MSVMPEKSLRTPLIQVELAKLGFRWIKSVSWNDNQATLYQAAIANEEVQVSETGALVAKTAPHTGRSPKDKFIVLDETTAQSVWWDNNQAMSPTQFDALKADFAIHARMKSLYVQDLEACADDSHKLETRVVTEHAWHALFMRHLLKPVENEKNFGAKLTIINLPTFKADPSRHGCNTSTVIAFDLKNNLVLIGGTHYAGEMKKAVFTVLNYLLPKAAVLPMHCSANLGKDGDTTIFFGLSGTGKTTLSADPSRSLIGDDEHGWSDQGVFNIENGCYAKAINLSAEAEPEIFKASHAFGSVFENVVMDETTRRLNLNDASLTENTRAAYPLSAISNASVSRKAPPPKTIIMLTADAFGVLPPIAKLNPEEAVQFFLLGYTAKLAGTESGVKNPEATFSACFGAPFLPCHPQVYASMLEALMTKHNTRCFLLNTGWTGGAYGTGKRMALASTRKLLHAAISGELDHAPTRIDQNFGLQVPIAVDGIEAQLLDPRQSWSNGAAYDVAAQNLVKLFTKAKAKFRIQVQQAAE
jgi:phosphoenolpyruvate carboxykinase (ATP)